MKKTVLILLIIITMIMPMQLFAIVSYTELKSTDTFGIILRANTGTTGTVTVTFTGTQITIDKIVNNAGVYSVQNVGVVGTKWTIDLGSNEIFGIANIKNGTAKIQYNDEFITMDTGNLAAYATQYQIDTGEQLSEYQIWQNVPPSPLKSELYPFQWVRYYVGSNEYMIFMSPTKWYNYNTVLKTDSASLAYKLVNGDWVYQTTFTPGYTINFNSEIKENNYDIYTNSTFTVVYKEKTTSNISQYIPDSSLENGAPEGTVEYSSFLNYILPLENSITNYIKNKFQTQIFIPKSGFPDKTKFSYVVTGGISNTTEQLLYQITDASSMWQINYDFRRTLKPGLNTIITKVFYDSTEIAQKSINITYYEDVVDTNEDGIDDRTGDAYIPDVDYQPIEGLSEPERSSYEDGLLGSLEYGFDKLMYYVSMPFRFVIDTLKDLVEYLTEVVAETAGVTGLLTELFSFLPAKVVYYITGTFIIISLIVVYKFMRG